MSQLEENDRALSRGLWWLPYSFLPFYILFYIGLVSISISAILLLFYYWRKFMINKRVSEKYDQHFGHATDNFILYFFLSLGLGIYFGVLRGVSSIFLNWAGQELSTVHSALNSIMYAISTVTISVFSIYWCTIPPVKFESCFQWASISLFLLSRSVYCMLPFSIYLTIQAVRALNYGIVRANGFLQLVPLGGCLSALMLCVKFYSFYTMLPLTIPFVLATIGKFINEILEVIL